MKTRSRRRNRKGNVLVLTAFCIVGIFALLACAVDLGYLQVARTELQRSADAAALAATWELVDEGALSGNSSPYYLQELAEGKAFEYAALNTVTTQGPALDYQDILVGYLANPMDPTSPLVLGSPNPANAVQVLVRKSAGQNGEVPLFFARALGVGGSALEATATAALLNDFKGFTLPGSGENLGMLPIALDLDTWNGLLAGVGTDSWTWDAGLEQVTAGSDGILEVNLFPQGTGSPGNRGTVDIGSNNNSTADIARQITQGVNEADLAYHGGELVLDENGELFLNGDTGISAGVKDELASIKGQPKIVPIFSEVTGPGNNAQYTIVAFAGVRILEVKLTGCMNSKRVTIQPAIIKTLGGIPGSGGQTSQFVYSPVWLVR
ncbi:MAG: pilus assembly protein TadG-related protein [Planctomycetota bacterium]